MSGTVKVARAATGDYPVGPALQLVPNKVMVKREKGFNATTRCFQDVNHRFGGNCFNCHVKALAAGSARKP